eukprot:6685464-Lingulodinium_polyedra.AAC.1
MCIRDRDRGVGRRGSAFAGFVPPGGAWFLRPATRFPAWGKASGSGGIAPGMPKPGGDLGIKGWADVEQGPNRVGATWNSC